MCVGGGGGRREGGLEEVQVVSEVSFSVTLKTLACRLIRLITECDAMTLNQFEQNSMRDGLTMVEMMGRRSGGGWVGGGGGGRT